MSLETSRANFRKMARGYTKLRSNVSLLRKRIVDVKCLFDNSKDRRTRLRKEVRKLDSKTRTLEKSSRESNEQFKSRSRLSSRFDKLCQPTITSQKSVHALSRGCGICKLWFPSEEQLANHLRDNHRCDDTRPPWMSPGIFRAATRPQRFPNPMTCIGCEMQFGSNEVLRPFEYYVHCIEQCPEYKFLDLIRECVECRLKFLNTNALNGHKTIQHYKDSLRKR